MSSKSNDNGDADEESITITHAGSSTSYDKQQGDFVEKEVVEVRCETMEDARDVGKVASLLKRHNADEVREIVEDELEGDQ